MNKVTSLLKNHQTVGDFSSSKQPGAGYHKQPDVLHTFSLNLENFVGEIRLQATLEIFPGAGDWFDLEDPNGEKIQLGGDSTVYNSVISYNSTGNFVWIRAIGYVNSGRIVEIRYIY